MNINYYLSYSHFLIAYPFEDFRARRVSGTALVQEIRFQFLFLKGFLGFFYMAVTYLSIFTSCAVFFLSPQARQNKNKEY